MTSYAVSKERVMLSDLPILSACTLVFLIIVFRAFSNRREGITEENSTDTELGMTELAHWPSGSPWVFRGIRSAANTPTESEVQSIREYNWRMTVPQWTSHRRTPETLRLKPTGNKKATVRILLENWRRSIVGLIRLADENLDSARRHTEVGNYRATVHAAFTSTENIARALVHCCGGKPDPRPGQEEALRMLTRRFKGEEKEEFEKAIDSIAKFTLDKALLGNPTRCLLNESRARQTLESASKTVALFKLIISTHFGEELQKLLPPTR